VAARRTLLEFTEPIRADEVLQDKLRRLSNVDELVNARTAEISGDGAKATGLAYADRVSGQARTLDIREPGPLIGSVADQPGSGSGHGLAVKPRQSMGEGPEVLARRW
jgi:alkyl hydroperoxide reductase subunit AhpF